MTRRARALAGATTLLAVMTLALVPTTARAQGYQCYESDLAVLSQTLDLTVVEFDMGPRGEPTIPSFPIAFPTDRRPEVAVVAVDGVPLGTPWVDQQAINLKPPVKARDVWIWEYRASSTRGYIRGSFGLNMPDARIARVEIRHPAPAAMKASLAERRALARRGAVVEDPVATRSLNRALVGSVINGLAAADMIRGAAPRAFGVPVEDVFDRSPRWVRIDVTETGLHRIDYPTLFAAIGADVDEVDPASLRIFGARHRTQPEAPEDPAGSWNAPAHLRERPLLVNAGASTFGPSDEILAFLPGPSGWSDEFDPAAETFAHDEINTDEHLSYWLTWDPPGVDADFATAPRRMIRRAATPTGADRIVTTARVRTHLEENRRPAFGLARDDWAWRDGIGPDEQVILDFALNDVVEDSIAWVRTTLRGNTGGGRLKNFTARILLNQTSYGPFDWDYEVDQVQESGENLPEAVLADAPVRSGSNTFVYRNESDGTPVQAASSQMIVDAIDVNWRRELRTGVAPLEWSVFAAEATSERWRFDLRSSQGDLDDAFVIDRTDGWNPVLLTNAAVGGGGTELRVEVDLTVGQARHFHAVAASRVRTPDRVERTRPRSLRREVVDASGAPDVGWDMVILYPPEFQSAAEDLVDLRRQVMAGISAPRVTGVPLQDVYDQFGHGAKDPAAIRNYFKFLYEVDDRFTYVLLVGDTNRDARGVLPSSDPDFCPTFVQDYWPAQGTGSEYTRIPFARDEWLVCFDDKPTRPNEPFGREMDLPDAAIGRLPVTSVSEASRVVRRILDYELDPTPGPWRNRVLLAADDERGSNSSSERDHVTEAECVSERVLPPAVDVEKLYLTEYPPSTPGAQNKPAARVDFREEWSSGALIVHYIGHGSPEQMADEVLFRIEDVPALTNEDRLPLFLAFSCDVAIYDDPTRRSMSEQLVLQDRGGAIAAIAASEVTFSNQNEQLTEAFYTRLFPDPAAPWNPARRVTRSEPIGVALMSAKWAAPGWQPDPFGQNNNAKYVLLGDPAMQLRSPEESVELAGGLAQAFRSGQVLDLSASLPTTTTSGRWYVEAQESARQIDYVMPNESILPYVLDGAAFFRGSGRFDGNALDLSVRSPAIMRFGDRGRLRVLMESGTEQFVGLVDSVDVRQEAVDTDDTEGPAIELDFAQGARRVQPGSVLVATLADTSGINTLGTTPANSILYEIGDSGITTDVTEEFQLDEGSTTRGTVEVPLGDVDPGTYTLRMTASDMFGNGGAAEIQFEVVEGGRAEIGAHVPVPNPFRTSTNFVVEVVSPTGPNSGVELEIDVHALDGSRVRTLRDRVDGGGGRVVVEWDGRDHRGDEIANGTYLYIVRARFATSPPVTETRTGRVVLMR